MGRYYKKRDTEYNLFARWKQFIKMTINLILILFIKYRGLPDVDELSCFVFLYKKYVIHCVDILISYAFD